MSPRRSMFFAAMVIFSNLLLLNSCGSCGKKEDPKQKLEKEAKQLIDKLGNKLKLSEEKKKEAENKFIKDGPSEKEADEALAVFAQVQAILKVTGDQKQNLADINKIIRGIEPSAPGVQDVQEASEVLDIFIDLLSNAKKRAKLKNQSQK